MNTRRRYANGCFLKSRGSSSADLNRDFRTGKQKGECIMSREFWTKLASEILIAIGNALKDELSKN